MAGSAEAHQIWIEQDGKATRLHFGEFGENLKEVSPGLLDKLPAPEVFQETSKGAQALKVARSKDHYAIDGASKAGETITAQIMQYPVYEEKDGDKVTGKGKWIPATRLIHNVIYHHP